jgi:ribose 1,5-bisphosphokinase
MKKGRLFAVVGPSGAGKDSLIAGVQVALPDLVWVRRVITRPATAGGEPSEGVTPEEFAMRAARGDFALSWSAHGLSYAIPATVDDLLAESRNAVFNGSRAHLAEAAARFPRLRVILITAPAAVLADRLAARGREARDDIAARLDRAPFDLPPGISAATVENDGTLERGVKRLLAAIHSMKE